MATCIFCPAVLGKTTRPEHILHNGLGGRKTTNRTICSACNNRFGGDIDKNFVEQFAVIRNLLQLRLGTGELPPMIKKAKAGKDTVTIERDGKLTLVTKPFTITDSPEGPKQLHVSGDTLEQIEANIPHMAAALKISEDDLRERLSGTEVSIEERWPDPIQFSFALGGPKAMRSAAKSCLVLWAVQVGNNEVKNGSYDGTIKYINGENGIFHETRINLDSRLYDDPNMLVEKYGPVFSMIYVKSNHSGRVVGHFTALNLIGFSIVLAEAGGVPNRQIALITDPITGVWSADIAERLNVPFEWLDSPDYDYDSMDRSRQRFDAMMTHQFTTSRSRELHRIIDDVLKGHGLKEGDLIPPEMAASISQGIAGRAARQLLGIPSKTPITPEKMRQMFADKPKSPD